MVIHKNLIKDVFPNRKKKIRITTTATTFIIIDETLIQTGSNNTNDNVWLWVACSCSRTNSL